MRNNLFDFATSELSQDAFICWLLSYAIKEHKDEEPMLAKCAEELLELFVGANVQLKEIKRQYEHIDILLILEDGEFVIIEDKTFSSQHGDQINRYQTTLSERMNIPKEKIHSVYLKIVEQPHPEPNVRNISRSDLLEVFQKYEGIVSNHIFTDYYDYLCKIDRDVNAYLNNEVDIAEWRKHYDHVYRGFFTHLTSMGILDTSKGYDWGWVANPSGGFWYLWWNGLAEKELKLNCLYDAGVSEMYLQIEDNLIVVKLLCCNKADIDYQGMRKDIFEYFKKNLNNGSEIVQQKTYRKGKHISVCHVEYNMSDYKEKISAMQTVMNKLSSGDYIYPHGIF